MFSLVQLEGLRLFNLAAFSAGKPKLSQPIGLQRGAGSRFLTFSTEPGLLVAANHPLVVTSPDRVVVLLRGLEAILGDTSPHGRKVATSDPDSLRKAK